MSKKVLIVGGGPAGSSAGIFLQKYGFRVALFEKGNEDRIKICGEGLTPEAQHALDELGLFNTLRGHAYQVNGMTLYGLDNNPVVLQNRYYTLQRSILDKILRNEIVHLGGSVTCGTSITNISIEKDRVIVEDQEKKLYEGDVVILATGFDTSLAKKVGFTNMDTYSAISMRAYADNTIACSTLEIYSHKKLFPAYGWIFPLPNNLINVGVYANKGTRSAHNLSLLMSVFQSVIAERYGKSLDFVSKPEAYVLNTGLTTSAMSSERVILCGENIASTYNYSGEGIGPALRSGLIAAKTLIQLNGLYTKISLHTYDEYIRRDFRKMHFVYTLCMKMFRSKPIFYLICQLLRHSRRIRKLVENVIDEKEIGERSLWGLLYSYCSR